MEFLNYFGKDRWIHLLLAEKRTRLLATIFPPFVRLGLVPDTISYVGIALLLGVILYFVRSPIAAVCFLAGHVICDGLDGSYARHTGKASQSGAFTDLVCDQIGMVAVAMMAVFHQLVSPLLGVVYISLYLMVVVFGVIINIMGLETKITITSKYLLYIVFAIWAFSKINFLPLMMYIFSGIMVVEVTIGYFRLKRGIRKKFDTAVRFAEGDAYSSKLNYTLNVAVPLVVLAVIVVGANWIPLRTAFDTPKQSVKWEEAAPVIAPGESSEIMGFGVHNDSLLLMSRDENGNISVRKLADSTHEKGPHFLVPGYLDLSFNTLPVDGNVLLVGDRTTHLLMGIDLDASFAGGRAVIVLTLPMGHLRITGMATAMLNGKKVWLAANYLYTRKTYIVDPEKALKEGNLLGGVRGGYVNGGFPSGMSVWEGKVLELNRPPFSAMLYMSPLDKLFAGKCLLSSAPKSFSPPDSNIMGPVIRGEDLVMLSPQGRLFRLPIRSLAP